MYQVFLSWMTACTTLLLGVRTVAREASLKKPENRCDLRCFNAVSEVFMPIDLCIYSLRSMFTTTTITRTKRLKLTNRSKVRAIRMKFQNLLPYLQNCKAQVKTVTKPTQSESNSILMLKTRQQRISNCRLKRKHWLKRWIMMETVRLQCHVQTTHRSTNIVTIANFLKSTRNRKISSCTCTPGRTRSVTVLHSHDHLVLNYECQDIFISGRFLGILDRNASLGQGGLHRK